MSCTHRLATARQESSCGLCGFDLRVGSDRRIVRRVECDCCGHIGEISNDGLLWCENTNCHNHNLGVEVSASNDKLTQ